ncbi:preprotein translocase subunit SecG [Candidatus Dojkabacteria bacterium]|nr:preprotein translocase subunit SecG [Candidatus Dojkabacteria bacterium]
MNETILRVSHLITTLLMVFLILLQNRTDSGSGFLSGGGETFKTRRGVEKTVFVITILISLAFVVLTILLLKL